MSVQIYQVALPGQTGAPLFQRFMIVSTDAEIPSSGLIAGDLVVSRESGDVLVALTATTLTAAWGGGGGGGDLLAANNLSDVASAATSFANIKQAATTTATGVVELATSGESAANVAVQGNDARMNDARTPLSHTHPATDISDSTAAGRTLLKAADAAAQRTALGLGTLALVTPTGTPDGTKFLRDDNSWQVPAGGASQAAATTIEVDLGGTAVARGRFTITDAAIGATEKLLVWQAPGPYTGKGTRADEAEMQPVEVVLAVAAAGSAQVTWRCPPLVGMRTVAGGGKLNSESSITQTWPDRLEPFLLGKVRGNVKFNYQILT